MVYTYLTQPLYAIYDTHLLNPPPIGLASAGNQRIFVGNMHHSVSEGDLIKLFSGVGKVNSVTYMWHKVGPNRGQPKGFAFVEMGR
jgi:RNA recognition motif-containing protein